MLKRMLSGFLSLVFLSVPPALAAGVEKSIAGISFTVPEAWTETQPASSMRAFQFTVPGAQPGTDAEMAVFYFGEGMGGGVQANIDRWKGQFTQLSDEKTEERQVNGIPVTLTELTGTYQPSGGPMMAAQGPPVAEYAVLGAIVSAPQGPVFFKMTGPAETVSSARESVEQLAASIQ